MERELNKELLKLKEDGLYPFHMPGHKRNIMLAVSAGKGPDDENDFGAQLSRMYELDITEIDGYDNLHDAKGIIRDAEKRAAAVYKSDETHFVVNGATGGILASVFAVTEYGDKIIMAANCHISVYNAVEIRGLKPVFIKPSVVCESVVATGLCGSISKDDIERAVINNPDARAVVITSPTYDGVLSDIAAIAKIVHEYDMPLIVDEAHGALFFMEGRSAVINGADIVINSVHKTLPALTQTALIHINGQLVNRNAVSKYLALFQTSSPSYVLMGSIDYAMSVIKNDGRRLYRDQCIRLTKLRDALTKLKYLVYIKSDMLIKEGVFDFDDSKILIAAGTTGLNGMDIYSLLRNKYGLQPEMAAGDYVLLMTTLSDTDDGINRLINALYDIDRQYTVDETGDLRNGAAATASENADVTEDVYLEELINSEGTPSEKTVFTYPPGIPIIVKGEIITKDAADRIKDAVNKKLSVKWID